MIATVALALSWQSMDRVPLDQRIAEVGAAARGVRVDGAAGDWVRIPSVSQPETGVVDASRDIQSISVAPTAEFVYVMLATRGIPSTQNYAFSVSLDISGLERRDVEFSEITPSGCANVTIFEPGQNPRRTPIQGVRVRIGSVVEMQIPWDSLRTVLPTSMLPIGSWSERPYIRATSLTWNHSEQRVIEHGPSAASYLLLDRRDRGRNPDAGSSLSGSVSMPLMFSGLQYVTNGGMQGPHGSGDHRHQWCYDLEIMDVSMSPCWPRNSANNADYYNWGEELTAPASGVVVDARYTVADHDPYLPNVDGLPSNYIRWNTGQAWILFAHLQQDTLVMPGGATVTLGQRIGRVGNTGPSVRSHLHLQAEKIGDPATCYPIQFANVRVQLNPVATDFWAVRRPLWQVKEGFFVGPLR